VRFGVTAARIISAPILRYSRVPRAHLQYKRRGERWPTFAALSTVLTCATMLIFCSALRHTRHQFVQPAHARFAAARHVGGEVTATPTPLHGMVLPHSVAGARLRRRRARRVVNAAAAYVVTPMEKMPAPGASHGCSRVSTCASPARAPAMLLICDAAADPPCANQEGRAVDSAGSGGWGGVRTATREQPSPLSARHNHKAAAGNARGAYAFR